MSELNVSKLTGVSDFSGTAITAYFDKSNTALTVANNISGVATAAFAQANVANTIAIAAFDKANTPTSTLSTFTSNVGNSSANSFSVAHGMNKYNIFVAVRENSTGYFVYPDIRYTNANTIVLEFNTAPSSNQYLVSVLGG